MFVIPALLSITLDATLAIVYFRQLLAQEEGRAWLHLLDVSASSFDLALAAVLRIVFLCPYIWSYMHRLRIVYSLLPWTWEAANMALVTARLVFLLSGLVRFDVEYFLVGASYASVLLQAVCLEHLRSSAPRERRIFLLGGAGAGGGLLDPALQPLTGGLSSSSASSSGGGGGAHQRGRGGGRELYDGHQEDVDFIAGITAKMKRAKAYWQGKTEALRVLWNDLGARSRASHGSSGSSGIVPASQQPFSLLLRLFTYEDVLGELDEAFARDPGQVEFYIPQFVTFLLYGAFWSSGSLQAFLLDKCARSVHFAHRLHWYLRAACLHGSSGINPDGLRQLTALMEDVKARGQRAAARLEEGRMPQELPQRGGHDGQPHRLHRGRRRSQSHSQQGSSSAESSGYWKEKEMQPCESFTSSTHTNRTSSLGVGTGGGGGGGGMDGDDGGSAYLDVAALPPPAPPLTPPPIGSSAPSLALATTVTGSSSVPSSPRAAAAAASTRFPLEAGAYRGADGDLFGVLPAFIDAITALSRDLMPVPRERRNAVLRSGLQELGAKFLPSNVVYMPVGNAYHRVWRVHALESFAFSTKERVPCLICFEVVDYARPPHPHYRQGGKHGKHGHHGGSSKWWSAMGMQENPLPAISRTFKFGNKEWTLKIGEPKEGGEGEQEGGEGEKEEGEEEKDRDDGGRPLQLGPPVLASPPQQQQHQGAATVNDSATITSPAALHSPGGRLTLSGGGPSTIDGSMLGGMGQWASAAAEESGGEGGTAGLPHLVLDIAAHSSEEAAAPPSAESRDDYGTFSPPTATSPVAAGSSAGGGPRKQPLLLPTEEEAEEEGRAGGPSTTATTATPSTTTAEVAPSTPHGTYHPPAAAPLSPATAAAQAPVIFKERWKQKEERLRRRSPVGHLPRWRLLPVIVKANDDLRQEQFASQLLRQIDQILRDARIPVWMRPYDIVATAHDGGLIEAIPDTVSLDALRRNDPQYTTLPDFFERLFGQRGSQGLQRARQAFVESLAAYSIVCFLLQIKDRHNGNILLDAEGHLIHIDFGFLLARSPGNVNFERAPFKLTAEFVEVMEGPRSPSFKRFRELCVKTYLELRRQRHKIILLVEMVVSGNETLPCFGGRPQATVEALRLRFQPELNDRACSEFVNGLIDQSLDNWRTRWYDRYQSCFELR